MKKLSFVAVMMIACIIIPTHQAKSQTIVEIIKAGIKKVIIAVDLKIQRLQNKTIWLLNAQMTVENAMSKA